MAAALKRFHGGVIPCRSARPDGSDHHSAAPEDRSSWISARPPSKLRGRGAQVVLGKVTCLPFPDSSFDLVCAFDIIEHVDDDDGALSELSRTAKPGGAILISMPLHPAQWTSFDDFVGHKRRYDPPQLLSKLVRHHLTVERSAVFGMQPRSSLLVDLGMWWLLHDRERAMWWYNWAICNSDCCSRRDSDWSRE
jgi:SAM-dependent methyltransferase